MPPKTIQQRFTKGEINPKLLARSDTDMYYSSASKLRNVISLPFGGVQRRGGLEYLDTLPNKLQIEEPDTITAPNGGNIAYVNDNNESTFFETNNLGTINPFIAVKYDFGTPTLVNFASIKKASLGNLTSASQATGTVNVYRQSFIPPRWGVASVTITNPGGGYNPASPPTVTFSAGSSTAFGVANVSGDGKIISISILSAGIYNPEHFPITVTIGAPPTLIEATFKIEGSNNDIDWSNVGESFTINNQVRFIGRTLDATYRYFQIIRIGSDGIAYPFKCAEFNLLTDTGVQSQGRLFTFSFNQNQTYQLIVTERIITVYKDKIAIASINADGILEAFLPTLKFTQSADTAIFTHPDMPPKKLTRGVSEEDWIFEDVIFNSIPKYNYDIVTPASPAANITPDTPEGIVVITATAGVFTDDSVIGNYIEGNGGRVKITERQSTTVVIGYTIIPFYTNQTIVSGAWTLTSDYENVWSAIRGWPTTVTFYEGRLWFGGSKSRPQTLWGSRVGLFFDFVATGNYDNDAIDVTIDTNELNELTNISGQRNLQIFTIGSEFYVPQSFNEPITPSNISVRQQTKNGAWPKTVPVDIEGIIFFVEKKGKSIVEFAYNNEQGAYISNNESILNSHLINQPIDLASETNNESEQSNFIYIVNADGTLCVGSILLFQNVRGYTLWQTNGLFKSVTVSPNGTYFIIERNGVLFFEKLDLTKNTDSFKYEEVSTPISILRGLEHLEGETLDVKVDGEYIGQKDVRDGDIILDEPAEESIEAGLSYNNTLLIKSNPIELIQAGTGISKKKRIAELTIRVYNSRNIIVNGEEAVLNGEELEDYTFYGIGDWGEIVYFDITQNKPYALTILAVQMNVNFEVQNG
ncbi:MAG TPA: hypothetical protein VMW66_02275 [Elusimicrobiales bacterium]|nr:hypothetical protein [Elusimicrobiales bacterium]